MITYPAYDIEINRLHTHLLKPGRAKSLLNEKKMSITKIKYGSHYIKRFYLLNLKYSKGKSTRYIEESNYMV